jgi:hypothetical protein
MAYSLRQPAPLIKSTVFEEVNLLNKPQIMEFLNKNLAIDKPETFLISPIGYQFFLASVRD